MTDWLRAGALTIVAAVIALSTPAGAARRAGGELPPSLADGFTIGSGSGVLCRAQSRLSGAAIRGMFDRGYTIVCRDAAAPVGRLYALRGTIDGTQAQLDAARVQDVACEPPVPAAIEGLPGVVTRRCRMRKEGVGYQVYKVAHGRTTYVAEGLEGYDSALRLGLRTIVADRRVPGEIAVATTSIVNPAAFARIQAGTLSPAQVLAQGYRNNNSGDYAGAAGFFDALNDRRADPAVRQLLGEYVANRALQRSNLGEFDQADALFGELARIPTRDPVQLRLRRNFRALHLVNRGRYDQARAELATPVPPIGGGDAAVRTPAIDADTAAQLNADQIVGNAADDAALTAVERGEVLDAQADALRGTTLRLQGDIAAAEPLLNRSLATLQAIRQGRVTSIARLRAQIMGELSAVAEARGDQATAERLLRGGVALIAVEYPGSAAENAAKARLAAYLARRGQVEPALALYGEVVAAIGRAGGSTTGMERLFAPYYALLVDQAAARPALAADFFRVAQTLVRPGVADTQAVLARELSGGSDEAARLFRQSVALARDVERTRIEVARLGNVAQATPQSSAELATAEANLARLEADQTATQGALSAYPRYRAVGNAAVSLGDVQQALRPGEAYLKLAQVGTDLYGLYLTRERALPYRIAMSGPDLAATVDAIRDSVIREVNGEVQTAPFDVQRARALYVALAGPVADDLATRRHLVFEPDGAMLRLPANLLVTDDASVSAYAARAARPGADPFDFRGVAWLGRRADISTAVSAQGFRDLRAAKPSSARNGYLGLGDNAPVGDLAGLARTRLVSARGGIDCNWPAAAWANPIRPTELYTARKAIGGRGDAVVTGAAFNDSAIIERTDLADYRIIHFATHGLVTAPRPECPARPALLTSFGPPLPDGRQSDGLLSFREVFDLKLDADLVILSACDTAGGASVAATREAGEAAGGGTALDGLVRAFVGAGGRAVLASHWPVPNDYDATERLVGGLFAAPSGTSIGDAMRASELKLMDDAATSHPYYWAAFALVGDGGQPLVRR